MSLHSSDLTARDDIFLGINACAIVSQVLRPGIEPIIYRDLFLFRKLASFLNDISIQKLGCSTELILDEFGEKLLEELDYTLV
jgi:predicted unusual protein kinase regulating ubiquinone biosynthesis (AarF/ABC1/UbiB family)